MSLRTSQLAGIVRSGTLSNIQAQIDTNTTDISGIQINKQNTLVAGDNITIVNNTISSSGGGTATIQKQGLLQIRL